MGNGLGLGGDGWVLRLGDWGEIGLFRIMGLLWRWVEVNGLGEIGLFGDIWVRRGFGDALGLVGLGGDGWGLGDWGEIGLLSIRLWVGYVGLMCDGWGLSTV